ncbi:MAG: SIMPL domain-containing protein [Bacteroidota bacterium]
MKNLLIFTAFLCLFSQQIFSQQTANLLEKDLVRRIEVTGSAEIEVVPDVITFSISLKEYFKDEKNFKDKVTIDVLERQLIKAVAEAGLPKESLVIGGITGYRDYQGTRKRPANFTQSKQYELILSDLKKVDNILSKVDEKGIQYTNIQKAEHSKIAQYRKEIKIKALQAAKEKAMYLLEGIGEKLGDPIEINEVDDFSNYPVYAAQANMRMFKSAPDTADAAPDSELEYQKIKIGYKMRAVFKIK